MTTLQHKRAYITTGTTECVHVSAPAFMDLTQWLQATDETVGPGPACIWYLLSYK